jgi:cytochrome c peroxidase
MTRALPLLLVAVACGSPEPAPEPAPESAPGPLPELAGFTPDEVRALLALSPLPDPPPDPTNAVYADPRAARLGRFVFFDARFSGSGDVSCATCHAPPEHWGDGKRLAEGAGRMDRHAMTLWNVAYQRWLFWDGRADSLWAQALQPLEDPREHATSRLFVVHQVHADPDLRRAYEELFGPLPPLDNGLRFPPEGRPVADDPDHPHAVAWAAMAPADRDAVDRAFANLGKSIAAFERLLVSRDAPFDRFVAAAREGDLYGQLALNEPAREGARLFVGKARCVLCHSGPNFSDREFHDNRVAPMHGGTRVDPGRYGAIPKVQADPFNGLGAFSDAPDQAARDEIGYLLRAGHTWSEFRTPSLRNVVLTAPYMHQGQLADLDAVIAHYDTLENAVPSHHQGERTLIPLDLTAEERACLREFLESLTDARIDPALTTKPKTPWTPPIEADGEPERRASDDGATSER